MADSVVVLVHHYGGESSLRVFRTFHNAEQAIYMLILERFEEFESGDAHEDQIRAQLLTAIAAPDFATVCQLWAEYMNETFDLSEVQVEGPP